MPIGLPPSLAALEAAARMALEPVLPAQAAEPVPQAPRRDIPRTTAPRASITMDGIARRVLDVAEPVADPREPVELSAASRVLAAYGAAPAATPLGPDGTAVPVTYPGWMPAALREMRLGREVDERPTHGHAPEEAESAFHARVPLDSPAFGTLVLALRLDGTRLEVAVSCGNEASRRAFQRARTDLDIALALRGLRLTVLETRHGG